MVEEDVREQLDRAADFYRAGDFSGALNHVTKALAVVEWQAPLRDDLRQEVALVRDRYANALAEARAGSARREQEFVKDEIDAQGPDRAATIERWRAAT